MRADATGLRRAFVLLTALRWLPVGFTTPLLVLLPLSRGLTLGQVGITIACGAATAALLELPTGGLADAVGRRPVLGASSLLGLAVFASMLVARWRPGTSTRSVAAIDVRTSATDCREHTRRRAADSRSRRWPVACCR